jgi:hypothetical protein
MFGMMITFTQCYFFWSEAVCKDSVPSIEKIDLVAQIHRQPRASLHSQHKSVYDVGMIFPLHSPNPNFICPFVSEHQPSRTISSPSFRNLRFSPPSSVTDFVPASVVSNKQPSSSLLPFSSTAYTLAQVRYFLKHPTMMGKTYIPRYSSCTDQVSSAHPTPCRGMVGQLLVGRPIEIFEIACRKLIAALVPYLSHRPLAKTTGQGNAYRC